MLCMCKLILYYFLYNYIYIFILQPIIRMYYCQINVLYCYLVFNKAHYLNTFHICINLRRNAILCLNPVIFRIQKLSYILIFYIIYQTAY